jgi:hypothetical protein
MTSLKCVLATTFSLIPIALSQNINVTADIGSNVTVANVTEPNVLGANVSLPIVTAANVTVPNAVNNTNVQEDLSRFCETTNLPPLVGQSPQGGCIQQVIQGAVPNVASMVSTLISSPSNGDVILPNTQFTIRVESQNLEIAGLNGFLNQPQVLNANGIIRGSRFVTIQNIGNAQNPTPAASVVQFMEMTGNEIKASGLSEGDYRICTLTSSISGQPVVMPVAQRGSQDDCIRLSVR